MAGIFHDEVPEAMDELQVAKHNHKSSDTLFQVDGAGDDDVDDHFRPAVHSIPASTAFTSIPCGMCPVFNECKEGGAVSPQTCVYFEKWLEF